MPAVFDSHSRRRKIVRIAGFRRDHKTDRLRPSRRKVENSQEVQRATAYVKIKKRKEKKTLRSQEDAMHTYMHTDAR